MTAVNWGRVSRPAFTAAGDAAVWRDDGQTASIFNIFSTCAARCALAHCTRLLLRCPRPGEVPSWHLPGDGQCADCPHGDLATALRRHEPAAECQCSDAVRSARRSAGWEIEYRGKKRRCTPGAGGAGRRRFARGRAGGAPSATAPANTSPCRRRANDGAALHLAAARLTLAREPPASNFFWAPVSVLTRADLQRGRFPIW